jgi:Protein of unknown function (DUF2934)
VARTRRSHNIMAMPSPPVTFALAPTIDSQGDERIDIEWRAYEIYESRGRVDGADLDDWLRAERELRRTETQKAY